MQLSLADLKPGTQVLRAAPCSKIPENAIPVEFKELIDFDTKGRATGANQMEAQRSFCKPEFSSVDFTYNRLGSTAELLMGYNYNDDVGFSDTYSVENIEQNCTNSPQSKDSQDLKFNRNNFMPKYLTFYGADDNYTHLNFGDWNYEYRESDSQYESVDTYKLKGTNEIGCSDMTKIDYDFIYVPFFEKYIKSSQTTLVSSVNMTQQNSSCGSDLDTDSSSDILIQI